MTETFQNRLNFLFATRLSPDGDEYSLREVSKGTGEGISPTYLQNLRRGSYQNPSQEKVRVIAEFFGVPASYFFDNGASKAYKEELDERLREAISDPKVKQIALKAMEMDEQTKALILHLMKKVKEMAGTKEKPR